MFNKEDKIGLKAIAVFGKSFPTIKDEKSSPLIINFPANIEDFNFSEDLLELDLYEVPNQVKNKTLIKRIFIGEVYTVNEMNIISSHYRFSKGMNYVELTDLNPDAKCVFYKDEQGTYFILAQLRPSDIVVSSTQELKTLLQEISNNFALVEKGMSRIRNITSKSK